MKPFNFLKELKAFSRWGFFFVYGFCFSQEFHHPQFLVGEIISSARNTPVPIFCTDSSVFVTYKTRFKRASKSDYAFAEYRTTNLKILRENLILNKEEPRNEQIRVEPYKKFYSPSGIFEIGSCYDSRRVEKSIFIRKTIWKSFETGPWISIWKGNHKRYKNYYPNFRFSHDSTTLLGTLEIFNRPDSFDLHLIRIQLDSLQLDSCKIPIGLLENEQLLEGFSAFENGKIGLIVNNRNKGEESKKEVWIFNPWNEFVRKFRIPLSTENAEIKMVKRKNSMFVFALEFGHNSSVFHQIRQWEIHSDSEVMVEKAPISMTNQQKKWVTQSFHRLSGQWIGILRNSQRNFKIFHVFSREFEDYLVVQAFDQYEKCNQVTRGIPNCNWIYSYGDLLLFKIPRDSSEAQLQIFPRYREYDVQLLNGDAGFPFFQNGDLKFLFGDEYFGLKRRRKLQSCVIFLPKTNQKWSNDLVFVNKKENLFLDETTGVQSDQKHLIFGGLKNKKSTLIKINLE